ncbi:MAG: hypothetical protein AB1801_14400 [Chloroflexota bacterium]
MPIYERISAVVSLTLIGLALYFVLDFPNRTATITLFDSPLALVSPQQWLMTLLLSGLVMAGVSNVLRFHPRLPDPRLTYLATFWTLPGLLVILATQTLGLAPNTVAWVAGLIILGVLLWVTILSQYHQARGDLAAARWPRLWQQVVGFSLAFLLYSIIYYTRTRSALSATGVLLVSGMVALALLRRKPETLAKTWLFAAIIGLGLGQITWALNYWRIGTLQAGLLLLVIFYVLVGLAQQQLGGTLSRRALWEFGVVALVGLVVIFYL